MTSWLRILISLFLYFLLSCNAPPNLEGLRPRIPDTIVYYQEKIEEIDPEWALSDSINEQYMEYTEQFLKFDSMNTTADSMLMKLDSINKAEKEKEGG